MVKTRVPYIVLRRNPKLLESYLQANQHSSLSPQLDKVQSEDKACNAIETLKEEPTLEKTELSLSKGNSFEDKASRHGVSNGLFIIPIIIIIAIIVFIVQRSDL